MEKLFESLDESIFTTELKSSLSEKFNAAVEVKALLIADERIEEELDRLDAKSSEYSDYVQSQAERYTEYVREETLSKVQEYLDLVVEEFVTEAKGALVESAKNEKADMLIEAFDSLLKATGNELADVVETRAPSELSSVADSRINSLFEEVRELQDQNAELIKIGLVNELCEGLTLLESAKFKRLVETVSFEKSPAYVSKLETIRESVKGAAETQKTINESTTSPIWSHLV